MNNKKKEEFFIICIKSVLQLLFSLNLFILILNKKWIFGTKNDYRLSVLGSLDEFCLKKELKPYFYNSWRNDNINNQQIQFEITNNSDSIKSKVNDEKLEPNIIYISSFGNNHKTYRKIFSNKNMKNFVKDEDKLVENNNFKNPGKMKSNNPLFIFEKVQYCSSYSNSKMIKKWFIYPNYLSYMNLSLICVSLVLSLNLTGTKNKWSTFELTIPLIDFFVFIISLMNVIQILYILTPFINQFQEYKFKTYFSTNFFIASISIGGFFFIFVLSIGIIHYRYEKHIKLKRFEDHIDNIQNSNSFIHIISNK